MHNGAEAEAVGQQCLGPLPFSSIFAVRSSCSSRIALRCAGVCESIGPRDIFTRGTMCLVRAYQVNSHNRTAHSIKLMGCSAPEQEVDDGCRGVRACRLTEASITV